MEPFWGGRRLQGSLYKLLRNYQGSVNGGFQTMVLVFWGNDVPLPPFVPLFNLLSTSV